MAVLRLHKTGEGTGTDESTIAIESGCISAELTEDVGTPNVFLRQLPAPKMIAASDLAAKFAAADDAISNLQQLLGEVRISHDELRLTLDDLKRDRDEWRGRADEWRGRAERAERAERLTERPWWRRLAG
jgi:hypothetical protein